MMTVQDLINQLLMYPVNMPVKVYNSHSLHDDEESFLDLTSVYSHGTDFLELEF